MSKQIVNYEDSMKYLEMMFSFNDVMEVKIGTCVVSDRKSKRNACIKFFDYLCEKYPSDNNSIFFNYDPKAIEENLQTENVKLAQFLYKSEETLSTESELFLKMKWNDQIEIPIWDDIEEWVDYGWM